MADLEPIGRLSQMASILQPEEQSAQPQEAPQRLGPPSPFPRMPEDDAKRIAQIMGLSPEQIVQHYLDMHGGDHEEAFQHIRDDRDMAPRNIPMRDAEHYLFGVTMRNSGPRGQAANAILTPGYSAAKGLAQMLPSGVGYLVDKVSPFPLSGPNTTPPSMDEVKYGLGLKRMPSK